MTLVSVVVPTHGRPSRLRRAIESVAAQTHAPLELLVVDDASPDPVEPIIESVDTRDLEEVVLLRHETNHGAAAARNTGIDAANGEIIAFLDDDDRWEPSVVATYVETFATADDDVGVVSIGARIENDAGEQIGTVVPSFGDDPLVALVDGARVGSFSRFAVTSSAAAAAGPIDEELPSWQDWEWQFRLARWCRFVGVSEVGVIRREGDHEQITDDFVERRATSYPRLLDRHRDRIADRSPKLERRFLATVTTSLASSALNAGAYGSAASLALTAIRYDPRRSKAYLFLGLALGGPITFGFARRAKRKFSGTL